MNKVFVKASASVMAAIVLFMSLVIPVGAVDTHYVSAPTNFGMFGEEEVAFYENFTIQYTTYDVYSVRYYEFHNIFAFRTTNGSYTNVKLLSTESFTGYRDSKTNSVITDTSIIESSYQSAYNYYYYSITTISNSTNSDIDWHDMPINTNLSAPQYVINPEDVTVNQAPQKLSYSLPAGNAIVIELGQGSNPYQITTTALNPGPVDGSGIGGKQWGFYNSLPSTIEYPLTGAYSIAFRGYGSTSVLGQYMTYSISGDFVLENHSEKYLIIVNPLWAYTSDGDVTNSRIDISIDKVNSFRVYPLGTQLVNGGWTSQNEGEYLDGNYDENTDTWYTTDEDGNIVESQVGGYNYVDYGPQNVTQWLENIAHQISGFFTGAIGAINTLVGAISNFSSTLMSLYIWLPPAVQGILTSAIILAITIGVIKVFI